MYTLSMDIHYCSAFYSPVDNFVACVEQSNTCPIRTLTQIFFFGILIMSFSFHSWIISSLAMSEIHFIKTFHNFCYQGCSLYWLEILTSYFFCINSKVVSEFHSWKTGNRNARTSVFPSFTVTNSKFRNIELLMSCNSIREHRHICIYTSHFFLILRE